ncbi:ABC transporter permease [Paenibacillus sp. J31TS4]|uniref:MFS transporter n=1 Tax=Paenibacillus sp. J31TS4 TaxID=2807195 RepID=UPI001B1B7FF8|nr:MFS transporter [Paenibacillus sp. J31TS4]GIP37765.1 ABC transporter permease [Paenibacillus sp. J31TS4]
MTSISAGGPLRPTSFFPILIVAVVLTGFSQGLLLPLLTVLLEQQGLSSGMNGLHAATMYVGVFVSMLFVEKPLARFGYRTMILGGMVIVLTASVLFPLFPNLWIWVALRFIIGFGESSLHYSTQLWVISSSSPASRGRNIALYGMSYAIGFSIGPVGINLLAYGEWVPFAFIAASFLLSLLLVMRLPNEKPAAEEGSAAAERGAAQDESAAASAKETGARSAPPGNRYRRSVRLAWFALLPSFLYGYMEATMNANFPVYGLRTGLTESWVSILLPAVGLGSLVLQLPLGMLSDRFGRKPVLITAALCGGAAFLAVPLAGDRVYVILFLLAFAGGLVGSFFSLGLAFLADLLPRSLLPAANVLASLNYSFGSMAGPNLGGFGMQVLSLGAMFYALGGAFLLFGLLGFAFRSRRETAAPSAASGGRAL